MEYNVYKIVFEGGTYAKLLAKDIQRIVGPTGVVSIMVHDPSPDTNIKIINADKVLYIQQINS